MPSIATSQENLSGLISGSGSGISVNGSSGSGSSNYSDTSDGNEGLRIVSIIMITVLSLVLFLLFIASICICCISISDYFEEKAERKKYRQRREQIASFHNVEYSATGFFRKLTTSMYDYFIENRDKLYEPQESNTDMICSICIDESNDSEVIQLNCGHSFHRKCIDQWIIQCIDSNNNPKCPLCNSEVLNILK